MNNIKNKSFKEDVTNDLTKLTEILERRRHNFSDIRMTEFGEILNSDDSSDEYITELESEDSEEDSQEEILIEETETEPELFKCKDCEFSYKWRSGLAAHTKMSHTGKFKCGRCSYCFNEVIKLDSHLKEFHDKEQTTIAINTVELVGYSNKKKEDYAV
jgi:hypothetical protein